VLFMLFPVIAVVLVIAAVLFVARELLLKRPDVAGRDEYVYRHEPGAPLREDDSPRYVDSTARPTEDAPIRVPGAEGPRA